MPSRKNTKQRHLIFQELSGSRAHPSADELFQAVRKRLNNISFATVYRNLKLLKEERKIQELSFGKGCCRYDPAVREHTHFFCLGCLRVYDMEGIPSGELNAIARRWRGRNPGFKIRRPELNFYGYCSKCNAQYPAGE